LKSAEKLSRSRASATFARKPSKTIQETSTSAKGAIGVPEELPNIKISKFKKKYFGFSGNFGKIFFFKSIFRDEKIIFENFRLHFRVLWRKYHIEKVCYNFLSIISEFPTTSRKNSKFLDYIWSSFAASSLLKKRMIPENWSLVSRTRRGKN